MPIFVYIDEVFAEVVPEEKISKIKELQDKGKKVGMVGDGINDAPALAQANVGMAIGTGTDVAIETGDIILVSGSLKGVSRAVQLSRMTMRTIKQNLFWAFFYNVVMVPLAILGALRARPTSYLRRYGYLIPILFALDRSGIVPDDGPTHQGINDIVYMRHLPNMIVMAPKDENELRRLGYALPPKRE